MDILEGVCLRRDARSIRVLPMSEGMQYDFASKNIVTQAVVSPAHTPLSFSRLQAGEFLDLVPSAAVVGIVAETLNQFFEGADQGRSLSWRSLGIPVRMRGW